MRLQIGLTPLLLPNFEVTGLADKRVPVDTTGVFELGIVLCDGEIYCEKAGDL